MAPLDNTEKNRLSILSFVAVRESPFFPMSLYLILGWVRPLKIVMYVHISLSL